MFSVLAIMIIVLYRFKNKNKNKTQKTLQLFLSMLVEMKSNPIALTIWQNDLFFKAL